MNATIRHRLFAALAAASVPATGHDLRGLAALRKLPIHFPTAVPPLRRRPGVARAIVGPAALPTAARFDDNGY